MSWSDSNGGGDTLASMTPRAAVLSIGDELTRGQCAETNGRWISEQLLEAGVMVVELRTVGDDREAIAKALRAFSGSVDLVVATGGLGPTHDDLTREGLAEAMGGVALEERAKARAVIEARFAQRGQPMPPSNLRQALCPAGAQHLENAHGTAPGIVSVVHRTQVYCLPGPPHEMRPMFVREVVPSATALVACSGARAPGICTIHACGLPESLAAELIQPLMNRKANPMVGTTASGALVSARICAVADAAHDGSLERTACEIERAWGDYAFGRGSTTIAHALGETLASRGESIAIAESCTGGLIGQLITSVPGSSGWFTGGWISYSDDFKQSSLGVDREIVRSHGAVSEQTACAMAVAAATRANAQWSVSATGIAGPTGGTLNKPIGTVWIGIAGRVNRSGEVGVFARQFRFGGEREQIRIRAATTALQLARLAILGRADVRLLSQVTSSATAST